MLMDTNGNPLLISNEEALSPLSRSSETKHVQDNSALLFIHFLFKMMTTLYELISSKKILLANGDGLECFQDYQYMAMVEGSRISMLNSLKYFFSCYL